MPSGWDCAKRLVGGIGMVLAGAVVGVFARSATSPGDYRNILTIIAGLASIGGAAALYLWWRDCWRG